MKKTSIITLLFLVCFATTFATVDNSPVKTEERTEEDLKVRPEVNLGVNVDIILATPKVNENEKIYDFAELLTEEEEKLLKEQVDAYIGTTNLDACIVTISENDKISTRDYAADFYDYNYFGKGVANSGIILLLDMDNRKLYLVSTGRAMQYYNGARATACTDKGVLDLKGKNYYSALEKTFKKIDDYYGQGEVKGDGLEADPSSIILRVIIFGTIINAIFILINLHKHKGIRKKTTATQYLKENESKINDRKDQFLTTHTSKTSRSSSSSGGGFSGSSGVGHSGGGSSF